MAIRKVCGIETEYGIVVRGGDNNPVAASSLLINAYVNATAPKVGWDFEDESPANDARGFDLADVFAPEIETALVNAVLPNGARYYVDHAHPEISMPEVVDADDVVRWDRAADEIVRASMRHADAVLPDDAELVVYKNNSDGKGNSYGCHENYLVDRSTPFGRVASQITAHFVTRQLYCGSGKVGTEEPGRKPGDVPFQLSQRADFFEEEVGLETTVKRPIVNTRDEPHCDARKYRRLHVIVGDANMSDVATFLKVGTTAILLAMIEDDVLGDEWTLARPVAAIHQISHDPTLTQRVTLRSGTSVTALDVQWALFELAHKYQHSHGLEAVGEACGARVLMRWEEALTGLETDPTSMASTIDWVAKQRLVNGLATRHDLPSDHPKLKAVDLQYHDLRPDRGLAERVGLERLVAPAEARAAMTHPPMDTRAYFRGRCLGKYGDAVVAANWDSLVFDVGGPALQRVAMMEPLKGTARHVGRLIDESDTAEALLARLEN